MFSKESIGRELLFLFIGAALAVLFGIIVAYPEMLANSRENAARIEYNRQQIEFLLEVHTIEHETSSVAGGQRNE